ncbi:MAG: hypothetical protein HQK54_00415 [Oligoflexales bacterium]|nr:hypothetical protein [Oligoflexales bacterium]
MTVIKRNKMDSKLDLITALEKLNILLLGQGEDDAVNFLSEALQELKDAKQDSPQIQKTVQKIIEAFEGDEYELMPYTLQRESEQWSEAEELSLASSRVLSLARRLSNK